MPAVDVPSREDDFVRGVSEVVGGPLGRHAMHPARRFWWPIRVVLLLTVVTCALGYAQKLPCRTPYWTAERQYTHLCYTDVYALYYGEALDRHAVPYREHAVEYPVVIGAVMQAASWLADRFHQGQSNRYFDLTALLLCACALVVAWTTAAMSGPGRRWDAAMVAVAPLLLLHAFTNWDLIAVALTGLAMLAWARRRPAVAGLLVGLGVLTKLYPGLLLVALLLLCLRAGRLRQWAVTAAATAVTFLAVSVPAWFFARRFPFPSGCPHGRVNATSWFYLLNEQRPADWDSLWYAYGHVRGSQLDASVRCGHAPVLLNALVAVTFVMLLGAIAALVLLARARPRVPQVAFLVVVAFLLSNKVYSPQYSLWLLPLLVLALPRWGPFWLWQASEVFLLFTRYYFFVGNDHSGQGLPIVVFLCAVLARDAVLLLLAGLVVRDVLRPQHDVVRRHGRDDPAGGSLQDTADAGWLVRARAGRVDAPVLAARAGP